MFVGNFLIGKIPESVDDFQMELTERIKLSSGFEGERIGPNLQGVIRLMAEVLHANQEAQAQLMQEFKYLTRMEEPPHNPAFWDWQRDFRPDPFYTEHGNGD